MGKNIIICSDGTGNTAIKGRGTNVFKMFESVDLNSHRFHPERAPQVAIYDDGVGTESLRLMRLLGGAAGYGLSRNVRQLYKELCRIYDPGDRIFLFGFSRGAFTVRSLSGFIGTCGIIDVNRLEGPGDLDALVKQAYEVYRRCYRTWLMKKILGPPERGATTQFRERHCHGGERIHFLGVWDTVDAVGLPLHVSDLINTLVYQFKFPDLVLSTSVDRAVHALAIDDKRQSFQPLIWDESVPLQPGQSIEQVWFSGAHSNVGGGYPKQGMSLVALDWMMHHAEQAGLRFVASERQYYREHANVDDKLYDPRAGLGTFYRWLPRDIAGTCEASGVTPRLHLSVLERIAHGTDDYRPGNLPAHSQVVFTHTGDPAKDAAAGERAKAAETVLREGHPEAASLLGLVRTRLAVGRLSYRIFMLTLVAVLLIAASAAPQATTSMNAFLSSLGSLLFALVTSPIDTVRSLFWHGSNSWWLAGVLSAGLLLAWLLSAWSSRGMNRVFAQFWFTHQQKLRDGLKRARARSAEVLQWRDRRVES
ncbi:DUF2235 domain-containing protein [Povalibacter sp.]|uniref:DUF2235 domain-containing protein n=1 Tax=Povalibacter sp. TaxID=1962978 RepID=UPI002F41F3A0